MMAFLKMVLELGEYRQCAVCLSTWSCLVFEMCSINETAFLCLAVSLDFVVVVLMFCNSSLLNGCFTIPVFPHILRFNGT